MSENEGIYEVENVDQFVDFITELLPFPQINDQIFEYLTIRELCLIPLVSKSWKQALDETIHSRNRHDKYLNKIKKKRLSVGQENWPIKRRTPVTSTQTRDALSDIRNVYRTRKPKNNYNSSAVNTPNKTQTPNTRLNRTDNNLRRMR